MAKLRLVTETELNAAPNPGAPDADEKAGGAAHAAVWIGIAGACVAVAAAYLVVRTMWHRRPPDETTERIQTLIDEANRLIRTLEEKK